jgi:hypothetical protein
MAGLYHVEAKNCQLIFLQEYAKLSSEDKKTGLPSSKSRVVLKGFSELNQRR